VIRYQGHYGHRPRSNWGSGDEHAAFAVGDIVYVPAGCAAIEAGRIDCPGVYRVTACFAISEDPSFYYRVSPMEPVGRGDRWRTLWHTVSDRVHVLHGKRDYTAGWVLLHMADPDLRGPLAAMRPEPPAPDFERRS
jgi:hypothetical protein